MCFHGILDNGVEDQAEELGDNAPEPKTVSAMEKARNYGTDHRFKAAAAEQTIRKQPYATTGV